MKKNLLNKKPVRRLAMAMMAAILLCIGCGSAEEETMEKWEHEGGWTPLLLAVQRDELNEQWEEEAKVFGENMGLGSLSGTMLKGMLLQGLAYETEIESLNFDGTTVTIRQNKKEKAFSFEYSWVETVEDVLDKAVYVFKTDDPKTGEFTYLCLTAPEEKKNDKGSYTTFNLINTADNYRASFDYNEGEGVRLPCTMIWQDTESEKLAGVLTGFFGDVGVK
jgi:hypothetical protein